MSILDIFKKKPKDVEKVVKKEAENIVTTFIKDNHTNIISSAELIYNNRFVDICSNACSICWDRVPPEDTMGKLNYLKKRIECGHTSILEHSNFVIRIEVVLDSDQLNKAIKVLDNARYLHVKSTIDGQEEDSFLLEVILAGSLRGFYYLIDNSYKYYDYNIFLNAIINVFYEYLYPELFETYIADKVMDKERFKTIGVDKKKVYTSPADRIEADRQIDNFIPVQLKYMTIENVDVISQIYVGINSNKKTSKYHFYVEEINLEDVLDMATITVVFNNMSRTATHQLVRHRNAITQESQRYVDYSNAGFTSPDLVNPIYDSNKKYSIEFSSGFKEEYTLQELGKELCNIYSQLVGKTEDGKLRKEDARAFLPSNVQCGKIYMTFTIRNLFKFFELRTAPAAQSEIKMYASELLEWWNSEFCKDHPLLVYDSKRNAPKYKVEYEYNNIDEEIN